MVRLAVDDLSHEHCASKLLQGAMALSASGLAESSANMSCTTCRRPVAKCCPNGCHKLYNSLDDSCHKPFR